MGGNKQSNRKTIKKKLQDRSRQLNQRLKLIGIKESLFAFSNKYRENISTATGLLLCAGAMSINEVIGTEAMLSTLSYGSTQLANAFIFGAAANKIKKWLDFGKKDYSDLSLEELKDIVTSFEKHFKEDLGVQNFIKEVVQNAIRSKEFTDLFSDEVGKKVLKKLDNEFKDLHKEHKKILDELKKCGIRSLETIIEETSKEQLENEKKGYTDGFSIYSWNPILQGWDLKRSISDELKRHIKDGKSILLLGESGCGKTNLIKRIAYDFHLEGWNVFVKSTDIKTEQAFDLLKEYDKCLVIIDDAYDNKAAINELLIKNVEFAKKIILLCAEKTEKWFLDDSEQLRMVELKEKNCIMRYLTLDINDVKNFLTLRHPSESVKEINRRTKDFMGLFARKPGEFLILLLFTRKKAGSDLIEKKYESINAALINDEYASKLLRKIFIIRGYEGDIPIDKLEELYSDIERFHSKILLSLRRKGLVFINKDRFVETFHPYLCKIFIEKEIKEKIITKKIIKNHLIEFLNMLEAEKEFFDNFVRIGATIGLEEDKEILPIAIKFFDKAISIRNVENKQKTIVFYNIGVVYESMPNGIRYENKKYMKKALDCYNEALKIDPNYAEAMGNKGVILYKIGRVREAILFYDKSLKINPMFAPEWYNKATALAKLGEYRKAIEAYNKALKINPKYKDAWHNKATTLEYLPNGVRYENKEYMMQALNCYDEALKIDPESTLSLLSKAIILGELKKYNEEIICYNKLIKIHPKDIKETDLLVNKGAALHKNEEYKKAITCYNKALKINPNNAKILLNYGLAYYNIKEYKKAVTCYNKALKINPNNAKIFFNKAMALEFFPNGVRYESKKYMKKALDCYNEALKIDPKDTLILLDKGVLLEYLPNGVRYENKEYMMQALDCYDEALKIDPKYVEVVYNKAVLLSYFGELKQALNYYGKALKLDPKLSGAHTNKGVILADLGKYVEALECFNKVLKNDPENIYALINKGVALKNLNKNEESAESTGKAAFKTYALGLNKKGDEFFGMAEDSFKFVYGLKNRLEKNILCYECGIAYAAILYIEGLTYYDIILNCWKYKDKVCNSARIVMEYLVQNRKGNINKIEDEKDYTFKDLLERITLK